MAWDYLKALDYYRIEREDKAEEASRQIKDRRYALRFEERCAPVAHVLAPTEAKRRQFGEKPEYTGRILAVGIAYNKDDEKKRHECKVEVLRERLA